MVDIDIRDIASLCAWANAVESWRENGSIPFWNIFQFCGCWYTCCTIGWAVEEEQGAHLEYVLAVGAVDTWFMCLSTAGELLKSCL